MIEHNGTSDNPFLFTGEQLDVETQDYYLRARYYSPNATRFLTRDSYDGTLVEPVTQNHYLYAGSNPGMYVDPSGNSFSVSSLSASVAISGVLATGATYAIFHGSQNGGDTGNIYATIYIYDIKSFLNTELIPSIWLIQSALSWQEEKLKNETYKRHKNRCDRFPQRSDYDSDCAYYEALISHAESCIRSYENWDKKYNPGRHNEKIENWKNTVKKNKKNYKRSCR